MSVPGHRDTRIFPVAFFCGKNMDDRQDEAKQLNSSNVETVRVKPMWIAQRCPSCNGWRTVGNARRPCDVCDARGYLKIPVEEVQS